VSHKKTTDRKACSL